MPGPGLATFLVRIDATEERLHDRGEVLGKSARLEELRPMDGEFLPGRRRAVRNHDLKRADRPPEVDDPREEGLVAFSEPEELARVDEDGARHLLGIGVEPLLGVAEGVPGVQGLEAELGERALARVEDDAFVPDEGTQRGAAVHAADRMGEKIAGELGRALEAILRPHPTPHGTPARPIGRV
jgi:hypothetical protein